MCLSPYAETIDVAMIEMGVVVSCSSVSLGTSYDTVHIWQYRRPGEATALLATSLCLKCIARFRSGWITTIPHMCRITREGY